MFTAGMRSALVCLVLGGAAGCTRAPEARQYPIKGQVLAVNTVEQTLTVRHEDIPDFMPGMTMTFPVKEAAEMTGRTPGELITATLEVTDSLGRLTGIVHEGTAPIEESANHLALATALLDVGDEVPDAAFIDQTDTRRSFAEWKGTLTLVNFVYTRCPFPTFCPLMDQNFATLQGAITEDRALRGRVKLVSVSIDPGHDTPTVLAAHAKLRRSDPAVWTWLTGDAVTVDRFAGRFGVGIMRPEGDSVEITHNLRTALVGVDGRVRTFYSGSDWTPATVLADLRKAVAGQP